MTHPPADESGVPVQLDIRGFARYPDGQDLSVEQFHTLLEDVLSVDTWDLDPYVGVLLGSDDVEVPLALVARVGIGVDGVSPALILPGIVGGMLDHPLARNSRVRGVSVFSEAWGYDIPTAMMSQVMASDESYEEFKKTAVRNEFKNITTVDIETGEQFNSMLQRGVDDHYVRKERGEGNIPEVLEYISETYKAR